MGYHVSVPVQVFYLVDPSDRRKQIRGRIDLILFGFRFFCLCEKIFLQIVAWNLIYLLDLYQQQQQNTQSHDNYSNKRI